MQILSASHDTADLSKDEKIVRERRRLAFLLSATSAVKYTCEVRPPYGATFVSDNLTTLFGHDPDAFVADPDFWASHIHPDERERVLAGVAKIFTDGKLSHEYRFLHGDGTYRWVHDDVSLVRGEAGEPSEMVGVFYDITARKETERARAQLERSFHALIDVLPVGVLIHRDRHVVFANRAIRALLRREADKDILGLSALALIPDAARQVVEERLRLLEAAPELTLNASIETEFLRLDGTRILAEVEAMKLDFDGAPAVLVLARDLSERRMMLAQLAASDRLASMGTLAAGVAHEINNPLSYVLTNLSLVSETLAELLGRANAASPAEKAQVEGLLHDAYEGASRVRDVVRDLRSLSRRDVDESLSVDVRQVLESCVRIAANEIRHSAKLVLDLGEVPAVYGNPTRLGQVFLNLILNATQALSDGNATRNELRIRTFTSQRGEVVIEVSDTGPGIPPEVIAHVFDPFFTTKPIGAGTGLGLSICHGIVTSMKGTIAVDSVAGAGSTFRVTFPVRAAASASQPDSREAPTPTRRGRVLVIDDERPLVTSLTFVIDPHHDVVGVTRAREALDLIARGETFDVILCDVMMPDISGMQFFEQLSKAAPALQDRVVFLTGGAFTQAAREFLQRVPNPRMEKPFKAAALLEMIAKVLR